MAKQRYDHIDLLGFESNK